MTGAVYWKHVVTKVIHVIELLNNEGFITAEKHCYKLAVGIATDLRFGIYTEAVSGTPYKWSQQKSKLIDIEELPPEIQMYQLIAGAPHRE